MSGVTRTMMTLIAAIKMTSLWIWEVNDLDDGDGQKILLLCDHTGFWCLDKLMQNQHNHTLMNKISAHLKSGLVLFPNETLEFC